MGRNQEDALALSLISNYFDAFVDPATLSAQPNSSMLCTHCVSNGSSFLTWPIRDREWPVQLQCSCSIGRHPHCLFIAFNFAPQLKWEDLGARPPELRVCTESKIHPRG